MHPPRLPARGSCGGAGSSGSPRARRASRCSRMVDRGELVVTDGRLRARGPGARPAASAGLESRRRDSEQWDGEWRTRPRRAAARDARRPRGAARGDAPTAVRGSCAKAVGATRQPAARLGPRGGVGSRRRAVRLVAGRTRRRRRSTRRRDLFAPAEWAAPSEPSAPTARRRHRWRCDTRPHDDVLGDRVRSRCRGACSRARRSAAAGVAVPHRWPGGELRDGVHALPAGVRIGGARVVPRLTMRPGACARTNSVRRMEQLLDAAERVLPDVVDLRRRIHAEPELGLELPKTQAGDRSTRSTVSASTCAPVRDARRSSPTCRRIRPTGADDPAARRHGRAADAGGHRARVREHDRRRDARVRARRPRRDARRRGTRARRRARRARAARSASCSSPARKASAARAYMIDEGLLDEPHVDAAFALHVAPNLPSGSIWTRGGAADGVGRRDRHRRHAARVATRRHRISTGTRFRWRPRSSRRCRRS